MQCAAQKRHSILNKCIMFGVHFDFVGIAPVIEDLCNICVRSRQHVLAHESTLLGILPFLNFRKPPLRMTDLCVGV